MIGKTISHYQIKRELGRGGMGVVYLADDQRLGRQVAIKALPAELSRDAGRRKRFEQEARACATLNHSAIASIFGLEEVGDELFIVFEYVDGEDLRALLRRGPLASTQLLRLAEGITRGLDAAHQAGIIHRDLKPENIRVNSRGEVKILDFGLARMPPGLLSQEATFSFALTQQGNIVGTVGYMSPEQLESRELDARTDIFSLGVILYEMAAGVHPFQGESPASTIANVLVREPAPIEQLNPVQPPALDRIVRKCLAKKKEHRYQSVTDLLLDLEAVMHRSDEMRTLVMASDSGPLPAHESDSLLASVFSRLVPNMRRWWELHHLIVALLILGFFPYFAWQTRGFRRGQLDTLFFFTVVILAIVNFVFRFWLLLSVAFSPDRKAEVLARLNFPVRATQLLLCAVVLLFTPGFVTDYPITGTVFAGLVAIGVLSTLFIEPWIERQAFPDVARLSDELKQREVAAPNSGARRWWFLHHLSAMLGWTPMMVALPWVVHDWLPPANNIADAMVFLCVLLALQNFGIRAYVLEVAWFHRDALETTVRKMAAPLLVCNLALAALCAAISALLFKTHFLPAVGFAVMAVGAAMIVGVLERNFNRYAFPGMNAGSGPADGFLSGDHAKLALLQVGYAASALLVCWDTGRRVDEAIHWLTTPQADKTPLVFGGLFLFSVTSLLVSAWLIVGILQGRAGVVASFKRWFTLFAVLEYVASGGLAGVLDRYTNLVGLSIGMGLALYGIRYQWILAKRILAAEKASAHSAGAD